ncbi:MAG: FAD-dependent oxidoreductase [Candidatus Riflebacteria bacterium]|nr:FAD-dependent oxidoreductase [Candidatus Riflebacteria bacterium]
MQSSSKIAIIGGGISGLWLARKLLVQGHTVTVFEKEEQSGGLLSGTDFCGRKIDRFYHFICRADSTFQEEIRLFPSEKKFFWKEGKTANFINGKLYPFSTPIDLMNFSPLPPLRRILFGMFTLSCRYRNDWQKLDSITALEWLEGALGKQALNSVFLPLLLFKFGPYYDKISAAWMWHRIHRVAKSRWGLFGIEKYGMYGKGFYELISELQLDIKRRGGKIITNTLIEQISCNEGKASGLRFNKKIEKFDFIFSTIPLPALCEILPEQYKGGLPKVEYLGVQCLLIGTKKPISPVFWLNLFHDGIPFNGIITPDYLANEKPNIFVHYVPFYLSPSHPIFSYDTRELRNLVVPQLKNLFPEFRETELVDFQSFKYSFAQPICLVGFGNIKSHTVSGLRNFCFLDAAHLYPSDRTISGLMEKVADLSNSAFLS